MQIFIEVFNCYFFSKLLFTIFFIVYLNFSRRKTNLSILRLCSEFFYWRFNLFRLPFDTFKKHLVPSVKIIIVSNFFKPFLFSFELKVVFGIKIGLVRAPFILIFVPIIIKILILTIENKKKKKFSASHLVYIKN